MTNNRSLLICRFTGDDFPDQIENSINICWEIHRAQIG